MLGKTMKKTYMKPQLLVVKVNLSTLICQSPLNSVNVNRGTEMSTNEEFE